MLIALGLALRLSGSRRGVGLYRGAVYVPTVVPCVAYALMWLWIFNPRYGPVNLVLGSLGLPTPAWLVDPSTAFVGDRRHRALPDRRGLYLTIRDIIVSAQNTFTPALVMTGGGPYLPLTVIVASWAGFAMAQLPARLRYALLALTVVTRMIPLTAVWLTRFA